jgi:hypothetical protein
MASRPPGLQLHLLPNAALDIIQGALSREEAAAACCVCVAWNRVLCTEARHAWARLDFAPPSFRRRVTAAVVRGACAKARDALTEVTLYDPIIAAAVLPALRDAHPRLACVTLLGEASLNGEQLAAALSGAGPAAGAGAFELRAGVMLTTAQREAGLPLLRHASLRATSLSLHAVVRRHGNELALRVRQLADAVAAHAPTLRRLALRLYDGDRPGLQRLPDDVTAPLVAALRGCAHLRALSLPARGLSAAAFDAVAEALAGAEAPLESLCFDEIEFGEEDEYGDEFGETDALAYLPAVLAHLLPRLTTLTLRERSLGGAAALVAVAAALPRAAALTALTLRAAGPHSEARGALFEALRALPLRRLEHSCDDVDLAPFAACLPVTLHELAVFVPIAAHDYVVPAALLGLGALAAAAAASPALHTLLLQRSAPFVAADAGACAAALLAPGAAPALRSLTVGSVEDYTVGDPIAGALRHNTTLTRLDMLGVADDDSFLALAAALPHNASLRSLVLSGNMSVEEPLSVAAVDALAAGVAANAALRSLDITVDVLDDGLYQCADDDSDDDVDLEVVPEMQPLMAAMQELCSARASCAITAVLQSADE